MQHIALWQALILGGIQGVSELFPISSLAQGILIPALLGWSLNQKGDDFLAFMVALHFATAIALLIYFWADWRKVLLAYVGSVRRGKLVYDRESKFAWLLVAGTVVVAAIAFVADKKHLVEKLMDADHVTLVAKLLVINGGVMIVGDLLKKQSVRRSQRGAGLKAAEDLSIPAGTLVGATQSLALLPGISRSGVSIIGGLLAGLSYEEACRFSFMLATPVITLAALAKLPPLIKDKAHFDLLNTGLGAVFAGITAYLSVRFLMRYFRHNQLWPFGCFCIAFGVYSLFIFAMR